jgi:hypothetical protein
MKKLLFFIGTFIIASLFAGCSKDDEKENPLIGTWESDTVTTTLRESSKSHSIKGQEIFIFHANKIVEFTDVSLNYANEGTYTTKGNSINFTFANKVIGRLTISDFSLGQGFTITIPSEGDADATVTEKTYSVNGDKLVIETTAKITFSLENITTYVEKVVYDRVK